jgi:hypothetical protein
LAAGASPLAAGCPRARQPGSLGGKDRSLDTHPLGQQLEVEALLADPQVEVDEHEHGSHERRRDDRRKHVDDRGDDQRHGRVAVHGEGHDPERDPQDEAEEELEQEGQEQRPEGRPPAAFDQPE